MDLPATQVCEDDFLPTQPIFHSSLQEAVQEEVVEIGMLCIDSKTYPIKTGLNTIGRHPNCNININDQTVSKKHAEIEVNNHETSAWICDLNSSNRTKLNNTILRPGRYYELKHETVLEFGTVRAIYKVLRNMDESFISKPSISSLQHKQKTVIPGTPDLSVNDSCSFERNSSIIPATQGENGKSVFRLPTVPLRISTDNARKSIVQDSSTDSSIDDSRSSLTGEKENIDEKKISVHDMETQKPIETNNESAIDIHDVETQKICLSIINASPNGPLLIDHEANIHNTEVQHKVDVRGNATDIHGAETRRCGNIHETKTPKKVGIRNETSGSDSTQSVKIIQTPENENEKHKTTDGKSGINSTPGASCSNETSKFGDNSRHMEGIEKDPQSDLQEYLKLQSPTTSDDEPSEHDTSRNKLGSQDLLANFVYDEDVSDEARSKSLTPIEIIRAYDDNDSNGKSSDDENIFEAATQITNTGEKVFQGVTERVKFPFKDSVLTDDSDEMNNECELQKYSRINSQDTEMAAKSQCSDSDSVTDEEGHFMEIALKEKKAASCSFEMLQRERQNVKINATSSTDSEDMFDTLTQPINSKNKICSIEQDEENKANVDIDKPTQVINREDNKNDLKTNENMETKEVNDIEPTQILPTVATIVKPGTSNNLISTKVHSDENDITEIEDNTPTQICSYAEKSLGTVQLPDKSPGSLESVAVEEYSVENIDYEMAPTQLISEVEKEKSASSNKANFDDTLEKNLNKIFGEENGQCNHEQPHMSTQSLESMLQSQYDNNTPTKNQEVNVEGASPDIIPKKSIKRRKTKANSVSSSSTSLSNGSRKSALINGGSDTDSQNSENYFSALTSTRRRNIITDSQDTSDVIEQKLNTATEKKQTNTDVTNSVDHESSSSSHATLKSKTSFTPSSVSNALSTAKPSAMNEIEEENVDENESMNINNQSSTVPDGEHVNKISALLRNDDEDIMAGLPEVRIAGTVSNPPSPASSVSSDYRINVNNNRSKPISITIAPKRKGALRKASKKSQARRSKADAEPYCIASKLNSSAILGIVYNSLSSNFDVDNVTINEDDGKVNKMSKSSMRRTRMKNSRRSQMNDSVAQTELITPIDLQTKMRQSPCIRRNGRTRSSSKENVDRSFVFQVGKEVPVDKTVEPMKKNALGASRVGKRLRSMTDTLETSNRKKRKEDVNGEVTNTKKRIIGARRQSANILNYMNERNSPTTVNESGNVKVTSNEQKTIKEAVIKLVRVSPCTPTGSISPSIPAEVVSKIKEQNKSELNRCASVTASQTNSDLLRKENKITGQKVVTRRRPNRAAAGKIERKVEELSFAIGVESQEVEMIMNGSLKWESISSNLETKKDVNENSKGVTTRKSRKRGNMNAIPDLESTERSTASELSNFDITQYDAPTSKVKRAKVSKNTSSVSNTAISKPARRTNTKSKLTTRSTQSQQQPSTDSSVEEKAKSTINQTSLDCTMNTTTRSMKGRSKKKGEVKVDKKQSKGNKDSTFSDTNSSIETVVMPSTPSRARRSMSSSFTISSPSKIKHKILFTGIPSTEYSKLLIKLNAMQVEDPAKCTVLVTDKVRRTVKFLCALALSIPIVSVDWLIASKRAGHFVNLEDYILQDPTTEDKFGFKLGDSLKKSNGRKLLEGYTIVLTPNITAPPLPELKSIISSCGGKVLLRPPTSWPQKAVIVSREEDLGNARKFLAKASKDVTIQSTEFILTGILRQELNFTEFKLK